MKLPDLPPQLSRVTETVNIQLPGGFVFQPNYISAGAIVLLLFLLILTMGQLRHRLLHWHMKGFIPGIAFGFILAIILEGFLLVGGRTALTSLLGWNNPPKPISTALETGKDKLIDVLGDTDENKSSSGSHCTTICK